MISNSKFYVKPRELAARYGYDEDKLMEDIDPETFEDGQEDCVLSSILFAAIEVCRFEMDLQTRGFHRRG